MLPKNEAAQGAPRDPRRDSRGERSPWLPLETRPDSPGEPGVQPRDPCLPWRGKLSQHSFAPNLPVFRLPWTRRSPRPSLTRQSPSPLHPPLQGSSAELGTCLPQGLRSYFNSSLPQQGGLLAWLSPSSSRSFLFWDVLRATFPAATLSPAPYSRLAWCVMSMRVWNLAVTQHAERE